jgi:hypothetical protein
MKLNATLAVSAVALLAACGGGGGATSEVPPSQNPPVTTVYDGIEFKIANNPNQGVRYRTYSDGSAMIWFDPELAVSEFTTYVQGTGVVNTNSSLGIERGNETRDAILTAAGPNMYTSYPVGNMVYNGESLMLINLADASEGEADQITKFGTANLNMDFTSGAGTLSAISTDSKSNLQLLVNTNSEGFLVGNGTFQTSGDTYTDTVYNWAVGCSFTPGGCGPQNITVEYDPINETSRFLGAMMGPNGTAVMGVSAGNSHSVGVSLE